MKTRLFALALALLMALSCTALAESTALTDQEGATVSMLAMNSWYSTVDLSDALLLNEIEKRANVEVEWNLIDPTIYADTVSPMLASGQDLPDIIQLPDTDNNMTYSPPACSSSSTNTLTSCPTTPSIWRPTRPSRPR